MNEFYVLLKLNLSVAIRILHQKKSGTIFYGSCDAYNRTEQLRCTVRMHVDSVWSNELVLPFIIRRVPPWQSQTSRLRKIRNRGFTQHSNTDVWYQETVWWKNRINPTNSQISVAMYRIHTKPSLPRTQQLVITLCGKASFYLHFLTKYANRVCTNHNTTGQLSGHYASKNPTTFYAPIICFHSILFLCKKHATIMVISRWIWVSLVPAVQLVTQLACCPVGLSPRWL